MHCIISSSSDMAISINIKTSSTLIFSLSLDTSHRGAATDASRSNTNSYSASLGLEMCSYIILKDIDDLVPTTSVDRPGSAANHL